jgi:hypothetical protein
MIRGGTYLLRGPANFSSSDSGTSKMQIVYEAYPNESVAISGGKSVMNWQKVSGNLWQASVSGLQYFEQLWMNGQRLQRTRTTSQYLYIAGPVYIGSPSSSCPTKVGTMYECYDRFYFRNGDVQSTYYDTTDVEVDDFEDWTMPRMRLSSVDTANSIAFLTGTTSKATFHGFMAGHRYLLENVKEALNQPGQWYLDRPANEVLYVAAAGENPNAESFVAPQLNQLLVTNGLSYVTFHGLTFSYANWVVPASGWASVQGESLGSNVVAAAVSLQGSSYMSFDSCIISHVGGYAIEFVGTGSFQPTTQSPYNNEFVNGEITDAGAGGIRVGRSPTPSDTDSKVAQSSLIENNVISGIGRFLPAGYGIYVLNSHNNMIDHNVVYDGYNVAIGVGATYRYNYNVPDLAHDNVVQYNLVYDLGQGVTNDMGGVYTAVYSATGTKILNNVIHDVTHDPGSVSILGSAGYGGWGIYFDAGSSNVVAENNLVYRTSQTSLHHNFGVNNTVANNIFAFGAQGLLDRSHDNDSISLTIYHNIFYWDKNSAQGSLQRGVWSCTDTISQAAVPCSSRFLLYSNLYWLRGGTPTFLTTRPAKTYSFPQWQGIGEDASSNIADPMFYNPNSPADNFTLRAGSPAISLGFVVFNPNQAGRFPNSILASPTLPAAFPTQLLDPNTDY